eukprot:GEMP01001499.1.p1 GENE.GEMP01001499.1~~GEMP01001499.1.p1  ORF type:complete len:1211 (+),score=204.26 GEMP01001499.1:238-3870(+)
MSMTVPDNNGRNDLRENDACDKAEAFGKHGSELASYNENCMAVAVVKPQKSHQPLPKLSPNRSMISVDLFSESQDTFISDRHKTCALLQRKWLKKSASEDVKMFLGARSVEGFRTILKAKYVTLTAAWKDVLDPAGSGRVSFHYFCSKCRAIGYTGNLKSLWKAMDRENTGFISLRDLDEEAGVSIERFKTFLRKQYGSILKAWVKGIDPHKSARVDIEAFVIFCAKAGYTDSETDQRRLFKWLKSSFATRFLTLGDLDPKSGEALERREAIMKTKEQPKSRAISPKKEICRQSKAELVAARKQNEDVSFGCTTFDEFMVLLKRHFGNLVRAWRHGFDPEGVGRVSFGNFCKACRECGFYGSIKNVWRNLDPGETGFVSLKEFDPHAYQAIESFKDLCTRKYGNLLLAWSQGLACGGCERVDHAVFKEFATEIGYEGNVNDLFSLLKRDPTKSFLTMRDFDEQCAEACRRRDFRMMTATPVEKNAKTKKTAMSFFERQEHSFDHQWRKTLDMAQDEGLERRTEIVECVDIGARTLNDFKDLLARRFGSVVRGFRKGLNTESEGRISFFTFCNATRVLGYAGNLKELWDSLNPRCGFVTLENVDPVAFAAIKKFKELLIVRYKNVLNAWRKGLDTNRNGRVDLDEFLARCEALKYEGDARYLFKCFDDGKRYLVMPDFDPSLMHSLYRGDESMLLIRVAPTGQERLSMTFYERQSLQTTSYVNILQGKEQKEIAKQKESSEKLKRMAAISVDGFKRTLVSKFGSVMRAWRKALDADGNGRLGFGELARGARTIGYAGNVKALWEYFDMDKSGFITLDELDMEAYQAVMVFRTFLLEKFGCISAAWAYGLDVQGCQRLTTKQFTERLKVLNFNQVPASLLFKYLMPEKGGRHLLLNDLDILLVAMRPKEARIAWSGEAPPMKKVKDRVVTTKNVGARTADDFIKMLKNKFGSIPWAWREGLDVQNRRKLSFTQFAKSARANGYPGNIKQLWKTLNVNKADCITLHDLDPEASSAMDAFKELCTQKAGNVLAAWKKLLDPNGNDRLDLTEFCEQCQKMGYKGNSKQLFRWFQRSASKPYLSLHDIDPLATEAFDRGDTEMLSVSSRIGSTVECAMKLRQDTKRSLEEADALEDSKDCGIFTVKDLKRELLKKYGSLEDVWENALDRSGDNKLSKQQFLQFLRQLGVQKTALNIWIELDIGKSGFITLDEFMAR